MIDLNPPSFYRPVFVTNSDRAADDIEGVLFFPFSFQFSSSNNGNESDISDMNLSSGEQSQTAVRGLFQVQFCQYNGFKFSL